MQGRFLTVMRHPSGSVQVLAHEEPRKSRSGGTTINTPPVFLRRATVAENGGLPAIMLHGRTVENGVACTDGDAVTVILCAREAAMVYRGLGEWLAKHGADINALIEGGTA